jgi:hypothetical protein
MGVMRRKQLIGVAIVLAVLVAALVVRYRMAGPRMQLSVTARSPLELSGCISEIETLRGADAESLCEDSSGTSWYQATVTNTGGQGAWISACSFQAFDAAGRPIPGLSSVNVPMGFTVTVGSAPYLEPGQSKSLDWFLPSRPSKTPASYVGSCGYAIYDVAPG